MDFGALSARVFAEGRGQSNPVGYIIVIAMVIVGTTAIVALGGSALNSLNTQAELERAEHSMTLFDSRAAMVALGASNTQTVQFGLGGGSFEVDGGTGYIALTHVNYMEGGTREVETIYNQSLGTVRYSNGGVQIAYQGGGVWRSYRDGNASMVSPPEFHYRQATLTLPIIQVSGNGSASGAASISMNATTQARPVFPDASGSNPSSAGPPYDVSSATYQNPVENGSVYAWVHSDFYQAWAGYFRQRTAGNVTVFDANQTVRLEMVTLGGEPGNFPVPNNYEDTGETLGVEALGPGHPIEEFTTEFAITGNANNAQFSYWVDTGEDKLEIHIDVDSQCGPHGSYSGWAGGDDFQIEVYYKNTTTGDHHEWTGSDERASNPLSTSSAFEATCTATGSGNMFLTVDYTSENLPLDYADFNQNSGQYVFNPASEDSDSSATIDEHPEDPGTTFQDTTGVGTMSLNDTVNHYFSFMGTRFDLKTGAGPGDSNRIDEAQSTGELRYAEAAGAQFITYLHVTENELEVNFD